MDLGGSPQGRPDSIVSFGGSSAHGHAFILVLRAKVEWNSRRSERMPPLRLVWKAQLSASIAIAIAIALPTKLAVGFRSHCG